MKTYTVRLHHDEGHIKITTAASDAATAVHIVLKAEGAPLRSVRWVREHPICDYGTELATRYARDTGEPLCQLHAREHYGSGWTAETGKLGLTRYIEIPASEWNTDEAK